MVHGFCCNVGRKSAAVKRTARRFLLDGSASSRQSPMRRLRRCEHVGEVEVRNLDEIQAMC
jgi:hypothetical protein